MEKARLICIGCPLGCSLEAELENGSVVRVSGNTCKNGEKYARTELTNPTRIVTTTVRVTGGTIPVVSVKTAADIPKGQIFACVKALRAVEMPAPVAMGQVVLPNVCGTGVDVIATKAIAKQER